MTDESVFAAALAIGSPTDRAAYLDRACAENPALRKEVEGLLAAHAASNPLDQPPDALARTGAYEADDGPPVAAVGDTVGPYRLMEQIGEGGFGLVFVAEQSVPVRRKVALKVLKPGMDTRDVVARFEAERQALALMDHPNIARVFDAGSTAHGRPYFAMELVRGLPVTEYCDARKLATPERLALFVKVCQAVQHAHQKGVIHRDIKPSNVLVTMIDGEAVPKVIDFGVAKAVGQSLTEKTIYTRFSQIVGTPLYMSPEQAEMSGVDVDTRADVYALGVLLYELLTGTTPFDRERFSRAAFDEMRRIIREEEPPRPSTRLSSLGDTLTSVSSRRGTDPGRLAGLVRGELDWIVMRCLEKDRNRRYDTAAGLAKDVQRHLSGDAVEACPPTLGYRLRKAYRRYRAVVQVAAAFAALIVGAGVMGVVLAIWASNAERAADEERGAAVTARQEALDQRDAALRLGDELRRSNYLSSIGLAAASLETGQVTLTRELLERTRPRPGEPDDLRGWEWHYLRRALQGERATLPGPDVAAQACAYSADGRYLAVAHGDAPARGRSTGLVRVIDLRDRRDVCTIHLGADHASAVAISPDGARVAATVTLDRVRPADGTRVFTDSDVRVWDVPSGVPLGTPNPFPGEWVESLAFSPDGTRVAVFHRGAKASGFTVLDAVTGRPVSTRRLTTVRSDGDLAYTADGRLLIAYEGGEKDKALRLLDAGSDAGPGRVLFDPGPDGAMVFTITFDGGGTRLVACDLDRVVRGWELTAEGPRPAFTFRAEQMTLSVRSFQLSPDGRLCAMCPGSYGPVVPVWDVRTGRQVFAARGHSAGVSGLAFSPDGRTLATASDDKTVKLWDVPPAAAGLNLFANLNAEGVAARPDGGFSVLAHTPTAPDSDDAFTVRDVASGRELFRGPPRRQVTGTSGRVVLAPDGARVATVNWEGDGRALVWDVATRKKSPEFPADGIPAAAARIVTPDRILIAHPDGTRRLHDLPAGRPVGPPLWAEGAGTGGFLLAARNGRAFTTFEDRTVRTVDAYDATVRTVTAPETLWIPLALSPDGGTLAAYAKDVVLLVDTRTGEVRRRLRGHIATSRAGVFSPDGRRLFTGSADHTVRVWDTATGQEVLAIRHQNSVVALALSADGHRLATQENWNGRGTIFDATPLPELTK